MSQRHGRRAQHSLSPVLMSSMSFLLSLCTCGARVTLSGAAQPWCARGSQTAGLGAETRQPASTSADVMVQATWPISADTSSKKELMILWYRLRRLFSASTPAARASGKAPKCKHAEARGGKTRAH